MWRDFISQDSHKDLNFKLKYNGKSSKCLRNIKLHRHFSYVWQSLHDVWQSLHGKACIWQSLHFSGTHFLVLFSKTERKELLIFLGNRFYVLAPKFECAIFHILLFVHSFVLLTITTPYTVSFIFLKNKNFFHDFQRKVILFIKYFSSQMLNAFRWLDTDLSRFNKVSKLDFFSW